MEIHLVLMEYSLNKEQNEFIQLMFSQMLSYLEFQVLYYRRYINFLKLTLKPDTLKK